MKEKIIRSLLAVACVTVVIIMTIWMWPNLQKDINRPWIDKWDSQME